MDDNQVSVINLSQILLKKNLCSSQRVVDWNLPPIYDECSDDGYLMIPTKEVTPKKFAQEVTPSTTIRGSLEPRGNLRTIVFHHIPIKEEKSWLEDDFQCFNQYYFENLVRCHMCSLIVCSFEDIFGPSC
ncbi:hypothetical protein ACFX19_002781 [Malus domestica]